MSFFTRVASLAAMSLCMFGLGNVATAGQAAELTTVSLPTTIGQAVLPITSLPQPALPLTGEQPAPHFASLEDAVAAQGEAGDVGQGAGQGGATTGPVTSPIADDVACLAGAIYFEAKGEPLPGQLAVANVIINRARSGRFPPDICGVVTQRGQFSFVRGGHLPTIAAAARGYRTAVALAKVALAKAWDSPAPEALFFHARRVGMGHGIQVASIGNHIFYR